MLLGQCGPSSKVLSSVAVLSAKELYPASRSHSFRNGRGLLANETLLIPKAVKGNSKDSCCSPQHQQADVNCLCGVSGEPTYGCGVKANEREMDRIWEDCFSACLSTLSRGAMALASAAGTDLEMIDHYAHAFSGVISRKSHMGMV